LVYNPSTEPLKLLILSCFKSGIVKLGVPAYLITPTVDLGLVILVSF
jgi:hypothetical protein